MMSPEKKKRNIAIMVILLVFVALFFSLTVVKIRLATAARMAEKAAATTEAIDVQTAPK